MGSSVSNIVKKVTKPIKKIAKSPIGQLAMAAYLGPAAASSGFLSGMNPIVRNALINAATQKITTGDVDLKSAIASGAISGGIGQTGILKGIQSDVLRNAATTALSNVGTAAVTGQKIDPKQIALASALSGGITGLQQSGKLPGYNKLYGIDGTEELPLYDESEPISGAQPVQQAQPVSNFTAENTVLTGGDGAGMEAIYRPTQIDADQLPLYDEFEPISGAQPLSLATKPAESALIPISDDYDAQMADIKGKGEFGTAEFPESGPGSIETQTPEGGKDLFFKKDDIQSLGQRYDSVSSAVKAGNYMDALREIGGAAMDRPLTSITLASLVAGAMATPPGEEDDEFDYAARKSRVGSLLRQYGSKFYSGADLDAFVARNLSEYAYGGRVGAMGGGIMGVPIRNNGAGIMELDYRAEGGFVPIGVKEKADDVPAMLSKNEFVMTADAVRGAGNGDIEKGAQKMYSTMKKLESRIS